MLIKSLPSGDLDKISEAEYVGLQAKWCAEIMLVGLCASGLRFPTSVAAYRRTEKDEYTVRALS
jgi:hypothetical protein